MTDRQKHLSRNALGLPNKTKCSYRNRFIGGAGHSDYPAWMELLEAGRATREEFSQNDSTQFIFMLTRSGAELALIGNEKLDSEDFPKIVKGSKKEAAKHAG